MISSAEFTARRASLARQLPDGAIAIISAASESLRNGDAHYRFRQQSDFYYLTGFNEPDAVLLIVAGFEGDSYLFNRPRNTLEEQWTGKRLGQEGARDELGMQEAFPFASFETMLPDFLADKSAVFYPLGHHAQLDKQILCALQTLKSRSRRGIQAPDCLRDIEPLISEMRLIKSDAEIELMRRAAASSVAAHKRAMRACRGLNNEYQLEAELLYELTRQGCRSVAYDSIVGGGANACVLHYTANNQPLTLGDLVLIDAGGEFDNYAADITRTFPINGQFTKPQRQLYCLVLKAQQAGIALIKPGCPWPLIQETIVRILTTGLCELGILTGDVDTLITTDAYKSFYAHSSGHWLGLDVHDCGRYKIDGEWRTLEPGMVLTVEPGLYITPTEGVDERWWNIGIRIEDDILVTQQGYENLTAALPVEIADIEALMRD